MISEELNRIINAKIAIKNAIRAKGVSVSDADSIDTYAEKILMIGGDPPIPPEPELNYFYVKPTQFETLRLDVDFDHKDEVEFSEDGVTWRNDWTTEEFEGEISKTISELITEYGRDHVLPIRGQKAVGSLNFKTATTDWGKITTNVNNSGGYAYFAIITEAPLSEFANKDRDVTLTDGFNTITPTIKASDINTYLTNKSTTGLTMSTTTTSGTIGAAISGYTLTYLANIKDAYIDTVDKLYLKGELAHFYIKFKSINTYFDIGGDIRTIISPHGIEKEGDEFSFIANRLFEDCIHLANAGDLILKNGSLLASCYKEMFSGCIALQTAPELPATTLADSCYREMFYNCKNLETAPALPATTLAQNCYELMFSGTALTTAPELPATTLAYACYNGMFQSCINLGESPALPATTLAPYCYYNMFTFCYNLWAAPELPATTLEEGCYKDMFRGTALQTAPALPATTLAPNCYELMFYNTALQTAPALPATTLADTCYRGMFQGCQFFEVTLPAEELAPHCYEEMFKNCSNLSEVTTNQKQIGYDYTSDWLYGVAPYESCKFNSTYRLDIEERNGTFVPPLWKINMPEPIGGKDYLTFEFEYYGYEIIFNVSREQVTNPQYSLDKVTWYNFDGGQIINAGVLFDADNKIYVRGEGVNTNNLGHTTSPFSIYGDKMVDTSEIQFRLSGNVMSLVSDDFENLKTLGNNHFERLFKELNVTDISGLKLPATTMTESCYREMFQGCKKLDLGSIPENFLPATNLAERCYQAMFKGCGTETTGDNKCKLKLPADEVWPYSYAYMFENSWLTGVPYDMLPATTVCGSAYVYMFNGCDRVRNSPIELPSENVDLDCYLGMFQYSTFTEIHTSMTYLGPDYTQDWLLGCTSPWYTYEFHCYEDIYMEGGRNESTVPSNWNLIYDR